MLCIPAAGMYRRAARPYRLAGRMEGLGGGIIYEKHHRLDYMPHTPYLVPSYPTKALRMALARLEGERPYMNLDIMTPSEISGYNGKYADYATALNKKHQRETGVL